MTAKAKLLKFEPPPDVVAKVERVVDQLFLQLKDMTVRQLAEVSQRLELRIYRSGRWIYLKDGRVSSQVELPRRKAKSKPRCPLAN